MKKILLLSLLLVMFMFLVSCAQETPLTDEELEAELTKLTPEEREELVKYLEAKESGALAGQAQRQVTQNVQKTISAKEVSPKVLKVRVKKVEETMRKLQCHDSDSGEEYPFFKQGTVTLKNGSTYTDTCAVHLKLDTGYGQPYEVPYSPYYAVPDCNQVNIVTGTSVGSLDESLLLDPVNENLIVVGWQGCSVREYRCPTIDAGGDSFFDSEDFGLCQSGCADGACRLGSN